MIMPGDVTKIVRHGVGLWEGVLESHRSSTQFVGQTWMLNIPSDAIMLVISVNDKVALVTFDNSIGFVDVDSVKKAF